MDNIESLVKSIVEQLNDEKSATEFVAKPSTNVANMETQTKDMELEYPLSKTATNRLKAKSGKGFNDVTYEGLISGDVNGDDLKTNAKTLKMQGEIARRAGKTQFAENLERASEMVEIPDEEVLRIYNLLRPNRTNKVTLLENAKMLREKYNAVKLAKLVEDAAEVYEKRGIVTN